MMRNAPVILPVFTTSVPLDFPSEGTFAFNKKTNKQKNYLHQRALQFIRLTNDSQRLPMKRLHRHQVHQFLLHAPMIWLLNSRLSNETTYLLPLLLMVPSLDSYYQSLITVK